MDLIVELGSLSPEQLKRRGQLSAILAELDSLIANGVRRDADKTIRVDAYALDDLFRRVKNYRYDGTRP